MIMSPKTTHAWFLLLTTITRRWELDIDIDFLLSLSSQKMPDVNITHTFTPECVFLWAWITYDLATLSICDQLVGFLHFSNVCILFRKVISSHRSAINAFMSPTFNLVPKAISNRWSCHDKFVHYKYHYYYYYYYQCILAAKFNEIIWFFDSGDGIACARTPFDAQCRRHRTRI